MLADAHQCLPQPKTQGAQARILPRKTAGAACANEHLDVVLWFVDCEAERELTQVHDPPRDLADHFLDDETANGLYNPRLTGMQMHLDEHGNKYRDGTEGMLDHLSLQLWRMVS
jgi:hypothetical protein